MISSSELFVSKTIEIGSLHRKRNPDTLEVAKVLSVQTSLENRTRPLGNYGNEFINQVPK